MYDHSGAQPPRDFLYDLKVMDPATHRRCTGVDNARILSNLRLLSASGVEVAIRIPLIPGVNDDEGNIAATGEFIAGLPRRHRVDLLPYHATARAKYARLGLPHTEPTPLPPAPERLSAVQAELSRHGIAVSIGG